MIEPPSQSAPLLAAAVGTLPVGAVMAYAGHIQSPNASSSGPGSGPSLEAWGWMPCDGRSLLTADYPALFAALGYRYGGGDELFEIPDLRGYGVGPVAPGTTNYIIRFASGLPPAAT